MRAFQYLEPKSLAEACSLLSEHKEAAKVVAGGQSLVPMLRHRLIAPQYVINLKGLTELEYIKDGQSSIRIGALTTHRAIETSPLIKQKLPILVEMEQQLASVQIRNWGTIGGSLCHADPAGDTAPVLIALGAWVRAMSTSGERKIALEDLFTDYLETVLHPDEILIEIQIPDPAPKAGGAYVKAAVRRGDMAIAAVAAVVSIDGAQGVVADARLVLGAVGPTPIRAKEAERVLVGNRVSSVSLEEVGAGAVSEADPVEDLRGSVEYKRHLVKVLTKEAVGQAIERARAA